MADDEAAETGVPDALERLWTPHRMTYIAGDDDVSGGTVSFRYRDGSQRNGVPLADAVAHVSEVVRSRVNSGPSAA